MIPAARFYNRPIYINVLLEQGLLPETFEHLCQFSIYTLEEIDELIQEEDNIDRLILRFGGESGFQETLKAKGCWTDKWLTLQNKWSKTAKQYKLIKFIYQHHNTMMPCPTKPCAELVWISKLALDACYLYDDAPRTPALINYYYAINDIAEPWGDLLGLHFGEPEFEEILQYDPKLHDWFYNHRLSDILENLEINDPT